MVFAYLFTRDAWSFYAAAVLFGLSYGGVMPLYALVTREYFGEKVMGSAYGAVFLISTLGMGSRLLGRRVDSRRLRQLRLALHQLGRDRCHGDGPRPDVPRSAWRARTPSGRRRGALIAPRPPRG